MNQSKLLLKSIQFLNQFKHVQRLSLISKNGRRESDAEHTWHLVLTLWMISEHYEKKIDLDKVIKMALIHDLPEMLAGDVFAHANQDQKRQKKENEIKAMNEIVSQLPVGFGKEVKELWEEYEERESEESKFVWLADKLMPRIQQALTEGDLSDNLNYDKNEDTEQTLKMGSMSKLFGDILKEINN